MVNVDTLIDFLGYGEQELVNIVIDRFGNENARLKSLTVKNLKMITSDLFVEIILAYLKHLKCEIALTPPQNSDLLVTLDASSEALLPYLDVTCLLKFILKQSKQLDFGINDILFPTSQRAFCILGLLENAVSFFDFKKEDIKDEVCNITQMIECHKILVKQREGLRQEGNKQVLERAHRVNRKKQLEDRIREEKICIKALVEAQKTVSDENDSVNAKLHNVKIELENKKETRFRKGAEIANLKKQIAPSPAQLIAEKEEHEERLLTANNDVNINTAFHEKCKKAANWNTQFINWQHKHNTMLQQAKDLKSDLLLEKKVGDQPTQDSELSDELEALQEEISMDMHTMTSVQEVITGLQLRKERTLNALKNSIANEEKENTQMETKYAEMRRKIEHIELCCTKTDEEGDAAMQERSESAKLVTAAKEGLITQYEVNQHAMGDAWDEICIKMQRELDIVSRK